LYVQYVRETASLRWWAGAAAQAPAAADQLELLPDDADPTTPTSLDESMVLPSLRASDAAPAEGEGALTPPPAVRVVPPEPRRGHRWAAAAAVFILVGVTTLALWPRHPVVATLASAVDAQWDGGDAPLPGTPLRTGTRSLRAGAVRIAFGGGAEVIVRGPAQFDLQSPTDLRLLRGRLTAQVGAQAVGFTVRTPSATVVDLGTEFGVDVDAAGVTEAHVVRGNVELNPAHGGAAIHVRADAAASVDAAGKAATTIPFRATEFVHSLPMIDLVDVVAGGDGTQGRRNAGINATNGVWVSQPPRLAQVQQLSDGLFHPCPGNPMVAGVFIPRGGDTGVVLDPAGHTFAFPKTDAQTWYWLWAGGSIPVRDDPGGLDALPTRIGAIDYNTPGHGVLLMRTNKGVTFDLAAIRAAHPGRKFTRFRAVCVNTSPAVATPGRPVSEKSEFRVLVDGELRFDRSPLMRTDPPFDVRVEIAPTARYLTLAATDGGDSYHLDWVTLGDPRLE
jgi:hypothetical protein